MTDREGYHWTRPWRPSTRQQEVLEGVAAGRSNPEIATDLGISVDGVKWHVRELLEHTGLGDRHQLGGWWREETGVTMLLAATEPAPTSLLLCAGPVTSAAFASSW